jgi:hypothetical protein
MLVKQLADPSGRAVEGAKTAAARLPGLRVRITPGALMSLVCVVSCQVRVSASGRSLVQRSPTECGVSELIVKPRGAGPGLQELSRDDKKVKQTWPTTLRVQ